MNVSIKIDDKCKKKCVIGCVNNSGQVKFFPKYRKLLDILYELGPFGSVSPESGLFTNFILPDVSQSIFKGIAKVTV